MLNLNASVEVVNECVICAHSESQISKEKFNIREVK